MFGPMMAAILLIAAISASGPVSAKGPDATVIEGIIERVSGDTVYVDGKGYSLAGAGMKNLRGNPVGLHEVFAGKYIQIHTAKGKILDVLVFDPVKR